MYVLCEFRAAPEISAWGVIMSKLGGIVAFLACAAPAHASLVEFVMDGEVAYVGSSGALYNVQPGTPTHMRFVLDTGLYAASDIVYSNVSSPFWASVEPVVSRFSIDGASFVNIQATLGDNAFYADRGLGGYNGMLSSAFNGDDYDLFMTFATPEFSLSMRDFNTSKRGGFTTSELEADALTTLALGFDMAPAESYFRRGNDVYGFSVHSFSVNLVPEPATLTLFVGGLLALGIASRRRLNLNNVRYR